MLKPAQERRMIYPRPDTAVSRQERGQGLEARTLVAGQSRTPCSPPSLPGAQPPSKQPPSAPLPSSTSPFQAVPSVWLCPPLPPPAPTFHPPSSASAPLPLLPPGDLALSVDLGEAALAWVCVCKIPHLCLLVFIQSCPVCPSSLEARAAHPASWYHRSLPVGSDLCPQWALRDGHQPADVVPGLGQGAVAGTGGDRRIPQRKRGYVSGNI